MQQINLMDDTEEEFRLAQRLKNFCCDASGAETDSAGAAKIIHQIGEIYRKRSPDKIALLKSAGLFNAAIVRNPSNTISIKSDLAEICQHILQIAKVKNQNVDLIAKAEQVKALAENLRTTTDEFLTENMPHISINPLSHDFQKLMSQKTLASRELNKIIADKYKKIMADISQFCENVMGKPPCEYAIAGMGSLARAEITPYSDFEHIILLFDANNYKRHLEYFRWFSVIFNVIILNLQETIIPSLNVHSLNDKNCRLGDWFYDAITPRGISFDGFMPRACKFPLGRTQHTKHKQFKTELIKPVSKMLEYLNSEADLKNGYHLADILTKTCFVFGNKDIFQKFAIGVQTLLNNQSKTETIKHVRQQVKDDMNNFSIRFRLCKLKSQNQINIKQFVYRSTTIFISALARLFGISKNSGFDVIEDLERKSKISSYTARKLQYVIAIACEIRLRVYMKMKSQKDDAIDLNQNDGMESFLTIVGKTTTINYFQIAYCLQCEIAKLLNFTKLCFYSDPKLLNISISLAFGLRNLTSLDSTYLLSNTFNRFWKSSSFHFDTCITELETETNWNMTTATRTTYSSQKTNLNFKQINNIANKLRRNRVYDEALEFYEELLKNSRNKYKNIKDDVDDINIITSNGQKNFAACSIAQVKEEAMTLYNIGDCHLSLKNFSNALTFLNRALNITQNIALNPEKDRDIANTLGRIGFCHFCLRNYANAFVFFNRALTNRHVIALNPDNDRTIAYTLVNFVSCHIKMCNYSDALIFLNRALDILQNTACNSDNDRDIAKALKKFGVCRLNMCNYSDSLTFLHRALDIEQNTAFNPDYDSDIANTLFDIGICHKKFCNYSDALTFLHRALDIKQNLALNPDRDRNIANMLVNIGICHQNLSSHSDSLKFLHRALDIEQNIALNPDRDRDIANTLFCIGNCRLNMCNFSDSLTFLHRALDIKQNIALKPDSNCDIAHTLFCIGICHHNLFNHSDALIFLNRALVIKQNIAFNADRDRDIAHTLYWIAICYHHLRNHSDSLKFLNRALDIKQNITLNPDRDRDIADTLFRIGISHYKLSNHSDALTFLNRALDIKQNITLNPDKVCDFVNTLFIIGICHYELSNYSDALTFLHRALDIKQNTAFYPEKDRNIAQTLFDIGTYITICVTILMS